MTGWLRVARAAAACGLASALFAMSSAAETERRVVLLLSTTDEAQRESLVGAIQAQVGDLPVRVVVEEVAAVPGELRGRLDLAARTCEERGAMGAFFVEAEQADDLIVYLVEPEAKRALVRRVKKTRGAEQAVVEEMSLVVRSTLGALLEGREIGMEQGPELEPTPTAPRPAPVPVDRPRPKPRIAPAAREEVDESRARLDAHYSGEAYAPQAPWQSGLGIELSASPDGSLFFGLGYTALPPAEVERETARVRVGRYPLRAFGGYELGFDRLRLMGQLGLIGELDRRSTTKTAGGISPTESDDSVSWAISPRIVLRYEVWQRTSVGAGVGLDLFVNDSEYVVELPSGRETLLSPHRARARAMAGVAVDVW